MFQCCGLWKSRVSHDIAEKQLIKNSTNETIKNTNGAIKSNDTLSKPTTKPKINLKDLEFVDVVDDKRVYHPGYFPCPVPFTIANCKNSQLFIMNPLQQCHVDDCEDCFIYIGPTESSVFLRNCKNCTVVVACQQFRTRDCVDIKLGLYCYQQPTFENSNCIEICPFEYSYPQLESQFDFSKPNDIKYYDFSNQSITIGSSCPVKYP